MVDNTRSNHIHIEVRHHISTYHHGAILFIESTNHSGQCIFIAVHVVTVQLYSELTTLGMMHTHVPATANTQVIAFGDDMDEAFVVLEFVNSFCGPIRRVVVDDNQVELKVGLLLQYRMNSITDGADTVAYGDDNRSFIFEVAC